MLNLFAPVLEEGTGVTGNHSKLALSWGFPLKLPILEVPKRKMEEMFGELKHKVKGTTWPNLKQPTKTASTGLVDGIPHYEQWLQSVLKYVSFLLSLARPCFP